MNFRGLIVAVVVLGILGGVLYWSQHRKTPAANTSTSASPPILTLNQADIKQITLKKNGAEPVTLVKAGKWQITEPKALSADQDTVSSLLTTLSTLNADRVVENKASDTGQYGFNHPALELDVTENNQKTQKLLLGDDTPTSGNTYAMLAGDPRVFTIAGYNKTSLDKSLDDLRDKRLLTVNSDDVSRVELIKKSQDMEFGRTKDGWQILKPSPLRADGSTVDSLVSSLANGTMQLTGAGTSDSATEFARAAPVATAKVTDNAGTQTLEIRKNKDGDYYAKSSAVDGAYKVDASLGQAVDKNLDDFRNKKLFDFSFDEPNKIELHDNSKTLVLTRSGEQWQSDGKKMDSTAVEGLVSDLRDLTATKFVTSGFGRSTIEATVTSNDGKRVEKVLISKSSNTYIAKRENEPSLYQLDSSAVEDLTKAADGIKPGS